MLKYLALKCSDIEVVIEALIDRNNKQWTMGLSVEK